MDAWVEHELAGGTFPDQRLKTRLGRLLGDLRERIGGTLPMACQDWAATKAAYRFFDNPRVDEGVILAGQPSCGELKVGDGWAWSLPRFQTAWRALPVTLVSHD